MRMALEVFGDQGLVFIEARQRRERFYIGKPGYIVRRVEAKCFSVFLGCLSETLLLAVSDSEIQVRLGVGWVLFDDRRKYLDGLIWAAILRVGDSQVQAQRLIHG